jgi:hypothetical protein
MTCQKVSLISSVMSLSEWRIWTINTSPINSGIKIEKKEEGRKEGKEERRRREREGGKEEGGGKKKKIEPK